MTFSISTECCDNCLMIFSCKDSACRVSFVWPLQQLTFSITRALYRWSEAENVVSLVILGCVVVSASLCLCLYLLVTLYIMFNRQAIKCFLQTQINKPGWQFQSISTNQTMFQPLRTYCCFALYSIALYCSVRYCRPIVLCCNVLYWIALFYIVMCCILHCIIFFVLLICVVLFYDENNIVL